MTVDRRLLTAFTPYPARSKQRSFPSSQRKGDSRDVFATVILSISACQKHCSKADASCYHSAEGPQPSSIVTGSLISTVDMFIDPTKWSGLPVRQKACGA